MSELRFDDRVVIVTGAGGGLGKAHALAFASRGAKVVVNDLGGGMHGDGQSQRAADAVVAEIKEAGGEAVANYDSVEDGDKIVQTALDTYKRIDVVVNNAGILRDVSFHKMSVDDWEKIYRVHVYGSFRVTQAAWPHMRDQGYGRIVMTASAAGIYGNFGQANYAMAKLGLVGFSNTLAIEGGRKNVQVNTIAPIAGSRLTETVLPQEIVDALKAEYVSPLVLWLGHESCDENGGLFEVGGGFFAKLRWERSAGELFRLGRKISVEDVKSSWKKIAGFEKSTHPRDITQSMAPIMENIQAGPSKGGNQFVDVDRALGYEYPERTTSYDERDLSIYALGVGAAADPLDDKELRYVYEMHKGGFQPIPTYGVIPAINCILEMAKEGTMAPGLNYGLDRLLHGEQSLTLERPLPTKAKLTHKTRIKEIFDKGKGAVINTETKSYDQEGDLVCTNEFVAFIRGAGGWGGNPGPSGKQNEPPSRAPDAVVEQRIDDSQALLYRLSGDWNPLHADPSFAQAFGFERPILHGLCTFGYAARHVLGKYAPEGDPRYFKSIKVRFAKSVFPGETIRTEMWKEADKVLFQVKVKERDEVVISNAAIELFAEIPKPKEKKPATAVASGASAPAGPISADVFQAIGAFVAKNPELKERVGKVFQFKLTGPDSLWTLDIKGGSVAPGETAKPDTTLEMGDADFMDMCTGKADAQQLYFGGKLKITGDVMASQKLSFLKKLDPALVAEAMNVRGGSSAGPTPAGRPASEDVFLGIKAYVADNPDLKSIGKIYQFRLSDPESVWTLDLKAGAVDPGETAKPDCTLEIAESDFMDMTAGKADAQKLYFGGKLKIGGDIMASQKLTFLSKIDPAWAKEQIAKLKAAGAPTTAAGPAKKREPAAPRVVEALKKALRENPALAGEVKAVVELRVADPDSGYTLDFEKGTVEHGLAQKPGVTLTLSDEDLELFASGQAALEELFMKSKLRIDGDIATAKRLAFMGKLI
jgi:(3R)-3-hydroxyacyl-CoA dehydrogenase / 3a,7a,12a-trihydroxy-5b-cholest-24-enoyl-CoA hydratase / enoyl-CoA hydratase 2